MKIYNFFPILFIFSLSFIYSQTLEGTSGLFLIPTAEIPKDGLVTAGVSLVNKEIISFNEFKNDAFTPYITLTFLPFLEISGKITRLINYQNNNQGIGDRTVSVRFLLVEESYFYPAVLIGVHDILGALSGPDAIHNNAFYLVGSKNFFIHSKLFNSISLHAGYGTDVLKADYHNFVGVFGGISIKFLSLFELMSEYDGKRANSGLRIKLFEHISLLGGYLDNKYFSGGASVNFLL